MKQWIVVGKEYGQFAKPRTVVWRDYGWWRVDSKDSYQVATRFCDRGVAVTHAATLVVAPITGWDIRDVEVRQVRIPGWNLRWAIQTGGPGSKSWLSVDPPRSMPKGHAWATWTNAKKLVRRFDTKEDAEAWMVMHYVASGPYLMKCRIKQVPETGP